MKLAAGTVYAVIPTAVEPAPHLPFMSQLPLSSIRRT